MQMRLWDISFIGQNLRVKQVMMVEMKKGDRIEHRQSRLYQLTRNQEFREIGDMSSSEGYLQSPPKLSWSFKPTRTSEEQQSQTATTSHRRGEAAGQLHS